MLLDQQKCGHAISASCLPSCTHHQGRQPGQPGQGSLLRSQGHSSTTWPRRSFGDWAITSRLPGHSLMLLVLMALSLLSTSIWVLSAPRTSVTAARMTMGSRASLPDAASQHASHRANGWNMMRRQAAARGPASEDPAGTPELNMTLAEAQAMAELFFGKVFPADIPSVPELRRQPAALHLMALLRKLWRAHAANPRRPWGGQPPKDHCSTTGGVELLQQVLEAVRKLQQESCAAAAASLAPAPFQESPSAAAPADPGLPFVVLRRVSILVLHLVYQQGGGTSRAARACVKALHSTAPDILLSFAACFNCSRSSRVAMELFHISKSGGTSMCQLAAPAGLKNPAININANCLVPTFGDEPKWAVAEPFMQPQHHFWAAVDCAAWVQEKALTCAERTSRLSSQGINFYSNELVLHEGTASLGSAAPCPQIETVTVLRQPLERTRSHVIEVDRVYGNYKKFDQRYVRSQDLQAWQQWAPAVLDNFMVRSMLGRHYLCRSFGAMGEPELLAAMLTLTSVDHVLLLEEGGLNEVVIRAGMGWKQGLNSKHWRWSVKHDLERDLHFPAGTLQQLEAWNQLDEDLYRWGKVLLRLDAAFHTAVAALGGRTECVKQAPQLQPAPEPNGKAEPTSSAMVDMDKALAQVGLKRAQGNLVRITGPKERVAASASVKFVFGFANVEIDQASLRAASRVTLASRLLPAGLHRLVSSTGAGSCAKQQVGGVSGPSDVMHGGDPEPASSSSSSILTMKLPLYSSTRSTEGRTEQMDHAFVRT